MFNDTIHTQEYHSLIDMANKRVPPTTKRQDAKKILGYVESHHVIPESIGGSNDLTNKVWLTAEEHVKAHILLTKMVDRVDHSHKMHMAAVRMITPQNIGREREVMLEDILNKLDLSEMDAIREESARLHSEHMSKKYQGEGNPFFGKTHTEETNKSRRKKLLGVPKSEEHGKNTSLGRLKNSAHISAIVTGTKNPRYNPTIYQWKNEHTGEEIKATRYEMTQCDSTLKSRISQVITGNAEHVKGWRIVK